MFELTCPSCKNTTRLAFVRPGAVASCAGCKRTYAIKADHFKKLAPQPVESGIIDATDPLVSGAAPVAGNSASPAFPAELGGETPSNPAVPAAAAPPKPASRPPFRPPAPAPKQPAITPAPPAAAPPRRRRRRRSALLLAFTVLAILLGLGAVAVTVYRVTHTTEPAPAAPPEPAAALNPAGAGPTIAPSPRPAETPSVVAAPPSQPVTPTPPTPPAALDAADDDTALSRPPRNFPAPTWAEVPRNFKAPRTDPNSPIQLRDDRIADDNTGKAGFTARVVVQGKELFESTRIHLALFDAKDVPLAKLTLSVPLLGAGASQTIRVNLPDEKPERPANGVRRVAWWVEPGESHTGQTPLGSVHMETDNTSRRTIRLLAFNPSDQMLGKVFFVLRKRDTQLGEAAQWLAVHDKPVPGKQRIECRVIIPGSSEFKTDSWDVTGVGVTAPRDKP